MSGGENKKFIERKAAYLQDHFLIWRDHQSLVGAGVYEFDLQRDDSERIVDSTGHAVKAVILTPMAGRGKQPSKKTHPITGYYLPFQPNQAFHHHLTDDVDFCFTPTLNGCTFVVGAGATPLISHYNYINNPLSPNPTIDQAKIDRHINHRYRHEAAPTVLRRGDYKTGLKLDYKVTIVGIREAGSWRFYYQRRSQDLVFVAGEGSNLVTMAENQCVHLS